MFKGQHPGGMGVGRGSKCLKVIILGWVGVQQVFKGQHPGVGWGGAASVYRSASGSEGGGGAASI